MAASEKARQWNDKWWSEAVKQKKTALPPTRNVRKKKSNGKKRRVP